MSDSNLKVYKETLEEYHKLNIQSISESGELDKGITKSYIIFLLKIDMLSKNPFLKDLHSYFLESNPKTQ